MTQPAAAGPDAAPVAPTPQRSPRKRWTLQARLMLTVVGIVSIIVLLIAVAMAAALRATLDQQLNDDVQRTSVRAGDDLQRLLYQGVSDPAAVLVATNASSGTLLILPAVGGGYRSAVMGDDAAQSVSSAKIAAGVRAAAERLTEEGGHDRSALDVPIDGFGTFRVAAVSPPGSQAVLGFIGLPVKIVDDQIGALIWAVVLVTIGGLIVLAVATVFVIRSGLKPLREVVATAEHVASLPLDRGAVAIADRVAPEAVDAETEIGRVGQALNTMLDHVEDSLQARARNEELMRRFVADASHELRTPLASIRGYSELSLRSDENPETTTTALERIQAQSLRMTRLVEDLLLLARLDEGQELVEGEVDLTPLAIDAVSDARMAGGEHHWNVDVTGESVLVRGDAGRINQVLTNLLANARTHTPGGTTVTLSLGTESGTAVIRVHDDGPGIDPSVRDDLFARFARADRSRARKTGGTGLGLSIAKAIADAHRGSLSVESEPGSTTFEFRLPLAPVTGTAVAPPHPGDA